MSWVWRWILENKDQLMVVLTFGATVAAIVYAALTVGLWRATRRQAETTRRMFDAANRPYVEVRIATEAGSTGASTTSYGSVPPPPFIGLSRFLRQCPGGGEGNAEAEYCSGCDRQVVRLEATKGYGAQPGVATTVETVAAPRFAFAVPDHWGSLYPARVAPDA